MRVPGASKNICRGLVNEPTDRKLPCVTAVEGLKLAALGFEKDVTKLSCCAV